MTEAELAQKFIEYFADCDVYQEVPMNGICDIVVIRDPVRIAIEVKKSLNFEVMQQAFGKIGYANHVYAAVPLTKSIAYGSFQIDLCKKLGIGVIAFDSGPFSNGGRVREILKPKLNRKIVKVPLHDWMKRSVAGSQNDRMTSFKFFAEELVVALRRYGPLTPQELFKKAPAHYGSISSFKSCVHGHVVSKVIKGVQFLDGQYSIIAS